MPRAAAAQVQIVDFTPPWFVDADAKGRVVLISTVFCSSSATVKVHLIATRIKRPLRITLEAASPAAAHGKGPPGTAGGHSLPTPSTTTAAPRGRLVRLVRLRKRAPPQALGGPLAAAARVQSVAVPRTAALPDIQPVPTVHTPATSDVITMTNPPP